MCINNTKIKINHIKVTHNYRGTPQNKNKNKNITLEYRE